MKSKVFSLLAAALAFGMAQATNSLLYWQVSNPVSILGEQVSLGNGDGEYAYARLMSDTGMSSDKGTAVASYALGSSVGDASEYVDLVAVNGSTLLADIGDNYNSLCFWVELYDANGGWVGSSWKIAGAELDSYVHDPNSFTPDDLSNQMSVMVVSYGTSAPEPSSGLLLLVGAGLLALRRRELA